MGSDIERVQQLEIQRLNQLYSALSRINRAAVRVHTRDALFQQICEVLVEHGGFCMAWVGWHDEEHHVLVPVARAGDQNGYVDGIRIFTDDRPEARGPTGLALAHNRAYVCNDLFEDPATLPWRAEQRRRGFQASAAFPIELHGKVAGMLNVYAQQKGYFQDKECSLLAEAALDLSFALEKLEQDAEKGRLEQLAEREQRFASTLIEAMPGIFYLYDAQGRFLRWNANFEHVSGFSAAEISTMHPIDLFAGEDRQLVAQRIAEVFERGGASVEASLVAKDGRATPHFFTGKRISLDGQTCLLGVGLDISERRRAEALLSESEQRYRSTLDNILEGCQLLSTDWRYLYLNDAAATQNRRPKEELLGRTMADAWPGIESTHVFELLKRTMERRVAVHEETEFSFADGTRGWFDVRAQPVPEGVLVLSLDITERKNAELLLRELNEGLELKVAERTRELVLATERAEAADRIKSAFLATMSHELRTPLNSIIGFTGIILQGLAGQLNPEQNKQLGMVQTSARHLLALINDVLDLSKIEAGQLKVHMAPFELRASIARAVALLRPFADKKGLTISVAVQPEISQLTSDQRRVEQILINLLNNAIKFSDVGGIKLSAERVLAGAEAGAVAQPAVRICIEDTGIGIKPEVLSTLFQPFRQIDSGLGRQHEGTGLGLAICRRLTSLLGGSVSAESEWGVGSTFTIVLPLVPAGAPS